MEVSMGEALQNNKATFAIYRKKSELQRVIEAFKKLGFNSNKLSFYQPYENGPRDFSTVQKNQVMNGAYVGSILGMLVVGCAYLFIGSGFISAANGPVELPMVSNIVGGFLAVVFGGLVGAACGTLVGIGTPDPAGKRYGQYLHAGGILVSIESNDAHRAQQAKRILEKTGGQEVHLADERLTWSMALKENNKISKAEVETVDMNIQPPLQRIGKDIDAQRHPEEQIVPKFV
jgi:hypothetical protein